MRRANYQSDSLRGCDSLGLSFDNDFWWQTVKKGGNEWKEHRPWNVWMTSLIYLSICCCLVVKPIKRQLTSSVVLKPLKIITMNQIHYAVCGPFFVNFLSLLSLWITCIWWHKSFFLLEIHVMMAFFVWKILVFLEKSF